MLFVQNLLHRQQLDEPARSPVKRRAFLLGVAAVAEGDEEAALPAAFAQARPTALGAGDRLPYTPVVLDNPLQPENR